MNAHCELGGFWKVTVVTQWVGWEHRPPVVVQWMLCVHEDWDCYLLYSLLSSKHRTEWHILLDKAFAAWRVWWWGCFKTCESPWEGAALSVCLGGVAQGHELIILMSKTLCKFHMKPLPTPPLTFHLAQNLCSLCLLCLWGNQADLESFSLCPLSSFSHLLSVPS